MKRNLFLNSFILTIFFICHALNSNALEEQELKNLHGLITLNVNLKGNIKKDVEQKESLTGIGVIGIQFIHQSGYPFYIEQVYPNSSATKAGLKPKDLIFAIDGIRTDQLNSKGLYQLLSGKPKPGSAVRIFITRGENMFNVEVIREDLANLPLDIQNRYLCGSIVVPL